MAKRSKQPKLPKLSWEDRFVGASRPKTKGTNRPIPESKEPEDLERIERIRQQLAQEKSGAKARNSISPTAKEKARKKLGKMERKIARESATREVLRKNAWKPEPPWRAGSAQRERLIAQETSAALAYRVIKESVRQVYVSLESDEPTNPETLKLYARELVMAVTAPASSEEERNQAIEVILAFPRNPIVSVLRNVVEKTNRGTERRMNAAMALARLGHPEPLYRIRREDNLGLKPRVLSWQILPPGWWNDRKYTDPLGKQRGGGALILERLRFVDSLNPKSRYIGSDKFGSHPYWVFVFKSHVVAECPLEGNAIY